MSVLERAEEEVDALRTPLTWSDTREDSVVWTIRRPLDRRIVHGRA